MRKKILEHLKMGRIKEGVDAVITLSKKYGYTNIYRELVVAASLIHRSEKEYRMNLISFEARERIISNISMLIMENMPLLKKNKKKSL